MKGEREGGKKRGRVFCHFKTMAVINDCYMTCTCNSSKPY